MPPTEKPTKKRKCTEDEPHALALTPTWLWITHSELWFKDGSMVLQAENTWFKVHQGILSVSSTVFSDMFLAPQPAGELLVEGCPIVHLSDTAKDIKIMLEAICQWK